MKIQIQLWQNDFWRFHFNCWEQVIKGTIQLPYLCIWTAHRLQLHCQLDSSHRQCCHEPSPQPCQWGDTSVLCAENSTEWHTAFAPKCIHNQAGHLILMDINPYHTGTRFRGKVPLKPAKCTKYPTQARDTFQLVQTNTYSIMMYTVQH